MATRKTAAPEFDLIGLFVKLVEFNPTKTEPVSVQEMDAEYNESTFKALGALADAELIEFERGNVWLNVPDVSAENAADIAREALSGTVVVEAPKPKRTRRTKEQIAADKAAERKRLEYNTNVAASQEPGSQHLHPMKDARPTQLDETYTLTADSRIVETAELPIVAGEKVTVVHEAPTFIGEEFYPTPATTPIQDSNGENITIPVDFDDPSKGRRELDASKGERVLSEDTYTVHAPKTEAVIQELADKVREIVSAEWTPSFSEAKNEPYEGPESIPAVPDGVRNNTWFMAHYADTETARAWWLRKAQEQSAAHEATVAEALGTKDVAPF